MSAPLVLTAHDLRVLADALDAYTKMYHDDGVFPGHYDAGVTYETDEGERIALRLAVPGDEVIISDRYGD